MVQELFVARRRGRDNLGMCRRWRVNVVPVGALRRELRALAMCFSFVHREQGRIMPVVRMAGLVVDGMGELLKGQDV